MKNMVHHTPALADLGSLSSTIKTWRCSALEAPLGGRKVYVELVIEEFCFKIHINIFISSNIAFLFIFAQRQPIA